MKVKIYAQIVVNEVEISEEACASIAASHLNAIPDGVFDQIEGALGANVELIGIERIDATDGCTIQEY